MLSQSKSLLIPSVKRERVTDLACELRKLTLDMVAFHPLGSFVACAGAATCRLGLCLSRNAADACAGALAEADVPESWLSGLDIRISGCANSCAQHQIAAIGLYGAVQRVEGCAAPGYRVMLGGRRGQGTTRFGEAIGFVPGRVLPAFLSELVRGLGADRQGDELFPDYVDRRGLACFETLVERHSHIPTYAEDPTFFRDIGSDGDFSLAGRKAGECGAGPADASDVSGTPDENAEDEALDLTGVPCPLNTVKAKLAMDTVPPGGTLRVVLDDGEPVERVPTTFRNEGYAVNDPTELDGGRWLVVINQR